MTENSLTLEDRAFGCVIPEEPPTFLDKLSDNMLPVVATLVLITLVGWSITIVLNTMRSLSTIISVVTCSRDDLDLQKS